MFTSEILWQLCLVLLQVIGGAGIILTRVTISPRLIWCCQLFLLIWLSLLGLTTVALVSEGSQVWLPIGATLAVTAVCATLDFRPSSSRQSI